MKKRPKNTALGEIAMRNAAARPAATPNRRVPSANDAQIVPSENAMLTSRPIDRVLAEHPVGDRHDPVHQREFHADVGLGRPAPVHLRVEDVHRAFGEVPRDVGVEDLTPAVRLGHGHVEILHSQERAEDENQNEGNVRPKRRRGERFTECWGRAYGRA